MRSSEHGIWRNYEPDATFAKNRLLLPHKVVDE
jgi:hypothetical protein